jgi:hypothetical protein
MVQGDFAPHCTQAGFNSRVGAKIGKRAFLFLRELAAKQSFVISSARTDVFPYFPSFRIRREGCDKIALHSNSVEQIGALAVADFAVQRS